MVRTVIVGDVHGCRDELADLLDAVGFASGDVLVSVGDLVDRGPDPAGVLDLVRGLPAAVVLMGNHERKHVRGTLSYSQQVTRAQLGDRYEADVAWMATLPYFHETDEVRVVHFGAFPGTALAEVPEDVLAGTTSGERRLAERYADRPWWEHYADDVPIAFGHRVFAEPLVHGLAHGLDTGACHGGRLTALVLPERRIVSVPARADHWARVRAEWQGAVLRTEPWPTMTFEQIEKRARKLRDPELSDAALDEVLRWRDALLASLPLLAERLDAEATRLGDDDGRVAAAHPAGSWLLRHRAGRLSRTRLGCSTPADVLALAAALGVEVPVPPRVVPQG